MFDDVWSPRGGRAPRGFLSLAVWAKVAPAVGLPSFVWSPWCEPVWCVICDKGRLGKHQKRWAFEVADAVRNKAVIYLLEQSQKQTIALERRPFRQLSNRSDVSWCLLKIRGSEVHFLPTIEVCILMWRVCIPMWRGFGVAFFSQLPVLKFFGVLFLACFVHLNAVDVFCMISPFMHLSFRLKSRGLWLQWKAYPAGGWDSRTSCPRFFDLFPGGDAWLMSGSDFDGTLGDFFAPCWGFQFHPEISLRSFEIEVVSWGHQAPPKWGRKVDEVCFESMGSVWQSRYWFQADRTRTRLLIRSKSCKFIKFQFTFISLPMAFTPNQKLLTRPCNGPGVCHVTWRHPGPNPITCPVLDFRESQKLFFFQISRVNSWRVILKTNVWGSDSICQVFYFFNCCQEQKHISGVTPTEPWELHPTRQRTAEGGMRRSSWASNRLPDDLHGIDKTWCHCQVLDLNYRFSTFGMLLCLSISIQPIKVKLVS